MWTIPAVRMDRWSEWTADEHNESLRHLNVVPCPRECGGIERSVNRRGGGPPAGENYKEADSAVWALMRSRLL